ncbi:MAG: hypothetical protein ABFD69_12125 [Candidatus Sumerlaeia bacterium]
MSKNNQPLDPKQAGARFVLLLLGCFLVYLIVQRAWLSDDAYITLRTIGNLLAGHGLVYNVGERVQAFTHPLWMILLAIPMALTWEFYYTTLAVSIALAVASLALLARRISVSTGAAILAFWLLALSKSFVEYSTSGLENVLTFFLLAWFYSVFFGDGPASERVPRLMLIAALGVLNRIDSVLLFAPALGWRLWAERGNYPWRKVAAAALPIAAWELFSIFYYGFALPNTAYAKAFTGFPHGWLWQQGLFYYLNCLRLDPVTLFATGLGIAYAVARRDRALIAVAAGSLAYLLYIVHIGGDFMSGRFFAAPLFAAVIVLARAEVPAWPRVAAGLLALLIGHATLLQLVKTGYAHETYSEEYIDRNGISDERAFYHGISGLDFASREDSRTRYSAAVPEGERAVIPAAALGIAGFKAGAGAYMLDRYALADPLLARLPAKRSILWRIGHFERRIPDGYADTLRTGQNRLADPNLALFYDHLRRIISGPLLSGVRFKEILLFNLGRYDHLVDRELYSQPYTLTVDVPVRQAPLPTIAWNSRGNQIVSPRDGILVQLEHPAYASQAQVATDTHHAWAIEILRGGATVARLTLPPDPVRGFARRTIDLPRDTWARGLDGMRLRPLSGQGEAIFGGVAVSAPDLLLIRPNGGERIQPGKLLTAVWQARPETAGREIRIELWRGGRRAAVLGTAKAELPQAVTSHFTLPAAEPGTNYRLRAVSVTNEAIMDESDGEFEVAP